MRVVTNCYNNISYSKKISVTAFHYFVKEKDPTA